MPSLPLQADARGERPSVVRQEAAVEAAGLVGEGHAGIEVEMPVDGVVDQEGALIEIAGAVGGDRVTDKGAGRLQAPVASRSAGAAVVRQGGPGDNGVPGDIAQVRVLAEAVPSASKTPRTILVARTCPCRLTDLSLPKRIVAVGLVIYL